MWLMLQLPFEEWWKKKEEEKSTETLKLTVSYQTLCVSEMNSLGNKNPRLCMSLFSEQWISSWSIVRIAKWCFSVVGLSQAFWTHALHVGGCQGAWGGPAQSLLDMCKVRVRSPVCTGVMDAHTGWWESRAEADLSPKLIFSSRVVLRQYLNFTGTYLIHYYINIYSYLAKLSGL